MKKKGGILNFFGDLYETESTLCKFFFPTHKTTWSQNFFMILKYQYWTITRLNAEKQVKNFEINNELYKNSYGIVIP